MVLYFDTEAIIKLKLVGHPNRTPTMRVLGALAVLASCVPSAALRLPPCRSTRRCRRSLKPRPLSSPPPYTTQTQDREKCEDRRPKTADKNRDMGLSRSGSRTRFTKYLVRLWSAVPVLLKPYGRRYLLRLTILRIWSSPQALLRDHFRYHCTPTSPSSLGALSSFFRPSGEVHGRSGARSKDRIFVLTPSTI